jgi:hypothetical protein
MSHQGSAVHPVVSLAPRPLPEAVLGGSQVTRDFRLPTDTTLKYVSKYV